MTRLEIKQALNASGDMRAVAHDADITKGHLANGLSGRDRFSLSTAIRVVEALRKRGYQVSVEDLDATRSKPSSKGRKPSRATPRARPAARDARP